MKTEKELVGLEIWIAEHVMGFKPTDRLTDLEPGGFFIHPSEGVWLPIGSTNRLETFHPATRSGDALRVLKECAIKLSASHFEITIHHNPDPGDGFIVTTNSVFEEDDEIHVKNCANADTLELAICLFARKLFEK